MQLCEGLSRQSSLDTTEQNMTLQRCIFRTAAAREILNKGILTDARARAFV